MSKSEKVGSLADLLFGAINEQDVCRFGKILETLDPNELEAVDAALKSNLPTSRIATILTTGGHKVNRVFLAEKRKCYTQSEACTCQIKTK